MVLAILRSKKFAKRILIAILILIIPAFILWGVGSLSDKPAPIGKIYGKTVTADDFVKSRQGTMIQVLLTYFMDYNAMNNILRNRPMINFMAWERLVLLDAAQKQKITVSNKDVTKFIASHPLFQRNGVFSQEAYASLLRNPAISMPPRQFEELVRENLEVGILRQEILGSIAVTDEDLLKAYKMNNDEAQLSLLIIDKDPFLEDVTVTDEEVRTAYDSNKERFFVPEKVDVEYIEIPYNDPAELEAITGQLEALYPEITGSVLGFEAIAKKQNLRYGRTGPFSRDDIIPGITFFQGFQDVAFNLREGQIGPPIFSSPEKGAAYIIRKARHIPPRPLEFEEVHTDLNRALLDAKAIELAKGMTDGVYTRLSEKTSTLEKEAEADGISIQSAGPVKAEEYIENLGPARELVYRSLTAGKGNLIEPLIFQKGIIITRVDEIIPADETDFNEKKEDFRNNITRNKQMQAMDAWFKERAANIELNSKLEEM
ncbi:peptidylprolyl isomerase [Candidatus Omnitrophota bacterium]